MSKVGNERVEVAYKIEYLLGYLFFAILFWKIIQYYRRRTQQDFACFNVFSSPQNFRVQRIIKYLVKVKYKCLPYSNV